MTTLQNWEIELYSAYIATSTAKNLKRSLRHKLIPIEGFFKFVLGIFLRDPLILIAFQIIKLSVTTLYFIRHPFLALYAVPANWRRIALQNNIMQPPEVLPGIDGPLGEKYDFGWWQISKISSYSWKIPEYNRGNMGGDFLVIVWAPAFLACLVFKSMAFFWSPLLWIAYPLHQTGDIAAAMARLCRLAIYKLQRWYSGIILGLLALKIIMLLFWIEMLRAINEQTWGRLSVAFIVPDGVALWQVAAILNCLITFGAYFVADYYTQEVGNTQPSTAVKSTYQAALVFRNVLTLYILICMMYIFIVVGASLDWWKIPIRLFPWG